jgi:hypothetical protein
MLPYPPSNIQQDIQPFCWLAKATEHHFNPTSHIQNSIKLSSDLSNAWFPRQFEIEASHAPLVAFETKKAAI